MSVAICNISQCDRQARTRGMCQMHYQRLWRHGDPNAVLQLGRPLGDSPSYEAAHLRVKAKRGRAADFPCVDCGRSAHHWSYKNGGGGYSADPDEYEPRCGACHAKFDRPPRPLCSIDGCNTAHHARGMCRKHYNQIRYKEGVIK